MLQEDEEWCHIPILECDISSVSIRDSLVYSTNYPENLFFRSYASHVSGRVPLPSAMLHGKWVIMEPGKRHCNCCPCCRTTIRASNLKFGAVLCGPWTCLRLHCIFFLVEGFELLSRLFFFSNRRPHPAKWSFFLLS